MSAAYKIYDKDAVLNATDIVQLIGDSIYLKKSGKYNYFGFCPFHDEDTASFCVNSEKQRYQCHGCGASGDALEWMMQYHRLNFPLALQQLAGRAGIEGQDGDDKLAQKSKVKRTTVEIEEALTHELTILHMVTSQRVHWRSQDAAWKKEFQYISKPPDEHWEREIQAAQRIAKALYAIYGVKV